MQKNILKKENYCWIQLVTHSLWNLSYNCETKKLCFQKHGFIILTKIIF